MKTIVRELRELITDKASLPEPWQGRAVINDDNMTYVVWNEVHREALVVDPMKDDWETLTKIATQDLKSYRFVSVIDTHTHADHISCAADLAQELNTSLIQHISSPSKRVHLRISRDAVLSTASGPLTLLATPGHTGDSITPIWGPLLFGGDTLMYGDTGRDDLPGGDPHEHWESLEKIKAHATTQTLMLPGHDGEGGRISSWKTQLEVNPSLTQSRDAFIQEAGAYRGPSPKLLKESLFENFK